MLNVLGTYSAYAQLTHSALVSVRDFMYKNGRNKGDCVHDLIATRKHQNNIHVLGKQQIAQFGSMTKLYSLLYYRLSREYICERTGCLQSSYSMTLYKIVDYEVSKIC